MALTLSNSRRTLQPSFVMHIDGNLAMSLPLAVADDIMMVVVDVIEVDPQMVVGHMVAVEAQ